MKSLFQTIFFISAFTILMLTYYLVKAWRQRIKARALKDSLEKGRYLKQRKLDQIFLKSLFEKIEANEIYWLEIHPVEKRTQRIIVTKAPEKNVMVLSFNYSAVNEDQKKALTEYGALTVARKTEGLSIELPFESKYLVDCVYYIYEQIMRLEAVGKLDFKF